MGGALAYRVYVLGLSLQHIWALHVLVDDETMALVRIVPIDAFAPSAIPLIARQIASCATLCVTEAPIVDAIVMQQDNVILPRRPR